MSESLELLSKISPKTICGKIEAPEKPCALFNVYGVATGVIAGESAMGPWEALHGNFEAVNLETGVVSRSARCFLPRTAHDLISTELKGREGGVSIKFALEIGIKPSDRPVGYEYSIRPLLKPADDDAVAELRALARPALTGPEHKSKK